jgi:YVTN family beta-propeller protein
VFNIAYVLIVPAGDHVLRADLDEVKSFRDDFTAFFESQTQGRGRLNTRVCPAPFTRTSTIPVGVGANDVQVSPNGRWAYVVSVNSDAVKVIDTDPGSATFHTVIDTITVSDAPAAVAFRKDSARAFVASINLDQVDVIDTSTRAVVDHLPVGDQPRGVFVNNANFGFVTNSADDDVTLFGANSLTVIGDQALGDRPQGVAGTLDSEAVVYTNRNSGTLTIHETRTARKFTVNTGDNPIAVALVQSESLPNQTVALANASPSPVSIAYVANADSDNVTVVSITTNPDTVDTTADVIDTIPVGDTPVAVAFQPNGAIAIVVNRNDGNVSLIEVAKHAVMRTVNVGSAPEGVAFAPDGKRAYVANSGSASVTVLE